LRSFSASSSVPQTVNFAGNRFALILENIRVEQYRNYGLTQLSFVPGINCFAGRNGSGKTNLLDAIYYLCSGKSYFNALDQQLIRTGESYFSLRGTFERRGRAEDVMCVLMKGKRKVIKRNDTPYSRMIEHYGEFPVVMVAPVDMELILGGSEERRKWLDSTIAMANHDYLLTLVRYEKLLDQRNAELRRLAGSPMGEYPLLDTFDEMLAPLGEEIVRTRREFLEGFMPYFRNYHTVLSKGYEEVGIQYLSKLLEHPFAELLKSNIRRDIYLERTGSGPHKDDLEFVISGYPLKRYGSQGQQKTFLLALKLSQYSFMQQVKGMDPLLLLDDISERLDEERLGILFQLLNEESIGQVFVTDSSAERVKRLLGEGSREARYFMIEKGEVE
jgi:DNA replication and repair protein RecF